MNDIEQRLRVSVWFGAHNGDALERYICAKQMIEAANEIDRLREQVRVLEDKFNPKCADDDPVFRAAYGLDETEGKAGVSRNRAETAATTAPA